MVGHPTSIFFLSTERGLALLYTSHFLLPCCVRYTVSCSGSKLLPEAQTVTVPALLPHARYRNTTVSEGSDDGHRATGLAWVLVVE